MGKIGKSAGQKRLEKMRLLCKLTSSGRVNIEDVVRTNPDLSKADEYQIFENYATNVLKTSLPVIGAIIRCPNKTAALQLLHGHRIGRIEGEFCSTYAFVGADATYVFVRV